jgi:hypothetical protein
MRGKDVKSVGKCEFHASFAFSRFIDEFCRVAVVCRTHPNSLYNTHTYANVHTYICRFYSPQEQHTKLTTRTVMSHQIQLKQYLAGVVYHPVQ